MKIMYVDTETTGLNAGYHEMHQLAGIVEIDGVVKEEIDIYFKPEKPEVAHPKALEVTGKSLEDLAKYPPAAEGHAKLVNILSKYVDKFDKNDKFIWAGQNCPFDVGFVRAMFKQCGDNYFGSWFGYHNIDLMSLSALMNMTGHINTPNIKLGTVAAALGITFEAHEALADIRATRDVMRKFIDIIGKPDLARSGIAAIK